MVCGSLSAKNPEVRQVVSAVRHSINLHGAELSEEFFPAHLTVALIDAVFNPQIRYDLVVPIVERYCQRFELSRLREKESGLPPMDRQESLSDLIGRYEELGLDGMQRVFQSRYCSPRHQGPEVRQRQTHGGGASPRGHRDTARHAVKSS